MLFIEIGKGCGLWRLFFVFGLCVVIRLKCDLGLTMDEGFERGQKEEDGELRR
jgi:hypothetical protein